MIRIKLGYCIREYGDIAYELLSEEKRCDDVWRIIWSLPMFAKAIHLTLPQLALEKEDIGDIIDCLSEDYLRYDIFEDRYEIVNCPTDGMHFEQDSYYLRLCFIAFILRMDKRMLIGSFIEACFLRDEKFEISEKEKEKLKIWLVGDYIEEIIGLYQEYSFASWKDISILRRHCDKVFLFIQNQVSEDSHRY